jgi:uncharacterized protein YlaI
MADRGVTVVKASCPICGDDKQVPADEVRFVVHDVAEHSFYEFTCPDCHDRVRKPAGKEVIRLLTLGGVVPERVIVPAEALEEHHGPALSWDDVLDFASLLDSDDVDLATEAAVR